MAEQRNKFTTFGVSRSAQVLATCFVLWGLLASAVWAVPPVKRARPPKFSKSISDVFFPNANSKLVGSRPDKPADVSGLAIENPAKNPMKTRAAEGTGGWSKLITAEVIEDEIKSQQIELAKTVANLSKFKGGDYQRAGVHLNVLAALFAIDAQYDGKVRWQQEAANMRDMLARAGANCKVGTDASYHEAKLRSEDLQNLVRGASLSLSESSSEVNWSKVADRASLMKRLEQAYDQGVVPGTASAGEFSRRGERLSHETQLISAIAEIIQRDGYEFAEDETYREFAQQMRTQALAARDAIAEKNQERARAAAGEIGKACGNCHEGYRN